MELNHHAYLVRSPSLSHAGVLSLLEREGVSVMGNPDLLIRQYDSLGVDDARGLKSEAILKPVTGKRMFVLSVGAITAEAQNALLKLFEEPTAHTHFFLILRPGITLLPTLASRLSELTVLEAEHVDSGLAPRFLKAYPSERATYVAELIDAGDRLGTEAFLNELLTFLRTKIDLVKDSGEGRAALDAVVTARRLLIEKGTSVKQALEYVIAAVPRYT